jgi:DNA-binding protein HU-beta
MHGTHPARFTSAREANRREPDQPLLIIRGLSMNKTELINAVAAKSGLSKIATAEVVDALLDTLKDALVQGHAVQLMGFGNFEITEHAAREGRNPATGAPLKIAAKKSVKFKPSKAWNEAVASGG